MFVQSSFSPHRSHAVQLRVCAYGLLLGRTEVFGGHVHALHAPADGPGGDPRASTRRYQDVATETSATVADQAGLRSQLSNLDRRVVHKRNSDQCLRFCNATLKMSIG